MKDAASLSESDLRAGHRKRLRDRFLADPQGMPDYEVLELALGCVYMRRDNKMLAKRLLAAFDDFDGLLSASSEELARVEGCGPAVDSFLSLLREIIARASQSNRIGCLSLRRSGMVPSIMWLSNLLRSWSLWSETMQAVWSLCITIPAEPVCRRRRTER